MKKLTLSDPNYEQYELFYELKRSETLGRVQGRTKCFYCDYSDLDDADCTCIYITKCKYTHEQIYDASVLVKNFLKRSVRSRKAKIVQNLNVPVVISSLIQEYL